MGVGKQQGCRFNEGLPPSPDELQRNRKALMPKNGRKERQFSQRRKSQIFSMFPLDKSQSIKEGLFQTSSPGSHRGPVLARANIPRFSWAHAETSDWRVPR